ncbi:titin homolog isoform X1 [Ptychodera flava]|uniref:titin homolog isoform X1 n=1 Tax=Ptychodera flava TaxID=63121 RepID=UPI003969FF3F
MAAAVGIVANKCEEFGRKLPEWKVCGVTTEDSKQAKMILTENMERSKVSPNLYSASSAPTLLRSIQQSHLCLPPSCYTDYSFEGLEAMAAGLPTTVQDDSHIAAMIEKHFEDHKDYCVVTGSSKSLAAKILNNLINNIEAFEQAKKLKEDLTENEAVTESLAKFASIFKEGGAETQNSDKQEDVAKSAVVDAGSQERTPMPSARSERTSEIMTRQHEILITEKREMRKHTPMPSGIPVTEDTGYTKGVGTEETTVGPPEISDRVDVDTEETTAMQPGISDRVNEDTEETTAMHPGISDRVDVETEGTTALQPGISDRVDVETEGAKAVQPGISDRVDVETEETTAVQGGMPMTEPMVTVVQSGMSTIETTSVLSEMMVGASKTRESVQPVSVNFGETKNLKNGENGGVVGKDENQEVKRIGSDLAGTPPSPSHIDTRQNRGSGNFMVHVGLNEDSYHQLCKTVEEVTEPGNVEDMIKTVDDSWKSCLAELDKSADKVITNETSHQRVNDVCKKNFGKVTATSLKKESLAISLNLPTLYNLYRVRHTCLSGSFPDSFEPLLITDKMREEADKVGLQLKLKATYDQARFDELQLFFINRDGGGLKPVKVYDDVIEGKDAEEIHIDVHGEDTDQKSDTKVTEGVADRTPTEHRQSTEDIQSKSEMERTTLESQLKEAKEEKATLEERCKELTQKLESTKQSLVSQRIENRVEREKLQSELEDKKKLINEFEDIVSELEHKLEKSEQRKSEEKGDGGGLKPVKVSDDVIEGKDAEEIHLDDEDTDQKSDTMITGTVDSTALEDIQSKSTLESQLKEAKKEKATLEEGLKEVTEKLESTEQSLVSQRIGKSTERREREKLQSELEEEKKLVKKLDTTVEEFKHNLEHSSQKKQAEKAPSSMPQQPPQHHHEMSTGHMMQVSAATGSPTTPVVYSQAQQMPYQTAQPHTQGTTKGQMRPQRIQDQPEIQHTQKPKKYRSSPQGHLTSPHHQGKKPIPQEIQTSATQISGDWSVTLVNGQHQGQGQKFKLPSGLAFHRDKLVVCDTGNNIVQILNKDYTCDKVIGSFDGQFAKPFRPKSVAISRFNHYFILDDENKQIVVCDENGKIIKIITLPENIKVVWDIALMDDFVLVTLSLTSLDITRPEDRDDRLVKYTQSGEYVKDVSGQTSVQTKFYRPHSVAVNSKNVIMVYDYGNECIKCFDSDLNFLHQFGQSQLQTPRTESVTTGYGYMAVDEDDNVYVCGFVRVQSTGDVIKEWIVKYGCDGKFICDLFKGHVSLPWCIAVMGDKIGVVELNSDQIKVFSK